MLAWPRSGEFCAQAALDELPQIFNVLAGEMSLVGPRPCLPNEFANYEPWQRERVNGLPGLTGLWQVSGKDKTSFNEMVRLDLAYLSKMSILLDVKIMLKTTVTIAGQVFEWQQAARRGPAESKRLAYAGAHSVQHTALAKNMKKQITVGVIGCGYWGPLLIRNFRSLSECRLKSVCDLDIARVKHACALYPDVEGLTATERCSLRSTSTLIVIATPVKTHFSLAKASLLAGKQRVNRKTDGDFFPTNVRN
jgi:hypothetical protein